MGKLDAVFKDFSNDVGQATSFPDTYEAEIEGVVITSLGPLYVVKSAAGSSEGQV